MYLVGFHKDERRSGVEISGMLYLRLMDILNRETCQVGDQNLGARAIVLQVKC